MGGLGERHAEFAEAPPSPLPVSVSESDSSQRPAPRRRQERSNRPLSDGLWRDVAAGWQRGLYPYRDGFASMVAGATAGVLSAIATSPLGES